MPEVEKKATVEAKSGDNKQDLKAMYKKFEEAAKKRIARGEKAEIFKAFIEEKSKLVMEQGQTSVAFAAMFNLAKELGIAEKNDRSYFHNIADKNWEVTSDKNGTVWIDISKPKTQKAVAAGN